MRKPLILALSVLSLAVFATPVLAATVRIDNARIRLALKPGETKSDQIRVENPTDQPAGVRVYAEDWAYKDIGDGDKDFYPAGTLERSSSRWITVNPQEVTIPPYGQTVVNYSLTVPSGNDKKGTYTTVLFFETVIGQATDSEGANVLVSGRVGSLIYVDIAGTVQRVGKFDKIDIKAPSGAKPAEFNITVTNAGNGPLSVEGEYLIMNAEGLVKGRGETVPIYIKEGVTATRATTWAGRLDAGTYDVIFTFDLGDNQIVVEEKKMQVGAAAS